MSRFLFIKSATELLSVSSEELYSLEYESAGKVALLFKTVRSGLEGTTKVVLNVTADREQEVVHKINKQLNVANKSFVYNNIGLTTDDKNYRGEFITGSASQSTLNVLSVDSITNTSGVDLDTTYSISCVDGDNTDEEKIRLTDSNAVTDDVVLEAGSGLSIARSSDKITFTNTVYGVISCGFFDDIGTTAHYLPLNGAPTEQPSDANSYTDWVCPCNIVVKSVQIRGSSFTSSGNLTLTVEKDPIGSGADTDVEAETVAVTGSDDQDVVHFLFDNAPVSVGERLKIKIQADADLSGNQNWFATVVYEADWSTRYTQASAIIAS